MAKAGCVYCDKGKDMSNDEYIAISLLKNALTISYISIGNVMYLSETEINYCPMCGKKLKGK